MTHDVISEMWKLWTGEMMSSIHQRVVEACFVSCMDHGKDPPSAHVTRVAASCGKSLADAVAAGLLTFGPRHGLAGGAASVWLRDAVQSTVSPEAYATQAHARGERLPGIGHRIYTDHDPRVVALRFLADEQGMSLIHLDYMQAVAIALSKLKDKSLPVNIDGAIGALMADIGAPVFVADALFICARTIGLVAHANEAGQMSTYLRCS